jgi:NAD(P)-dependent dehydrogenase (short-subunit alcohol dehydrogenase family)
MVMNTVIVTGASGNLGQAVVKKFLKEGFKVIGTVHHNEGYAGDEMYETAIVDLTNEDNSQQFVQSVIAKHEHIDAAVLTAGGFAMNKISEMKTADVASQYRLNFETAFNIARPVFLQMLAQKSGRIFLIGSRQGLDAKGGRGSVAYTLSKSLLFRLAELMNEEAKGTGVVTSVVVPGTIDTPQNREAMPGASFGNWVKPEEIAEVIHFYCTGQGKILREPILKVYGNG